MRRESRREHNPVQASSDGARERADLLAPPEERAQKKEAVNNGGVLSVDTGEFNLPNDFTEKEDQQARLLGLEPVALVILVFALAFIGFITYLIYTEPPK